MIHGCKDSWKFGKIKRTYKALSGEFSGTLDYKSQHAFFADVLFKQALKEFTVSHSVTHSMK